MIHWRFKWVEKNRPFVTKLMETRAKRFQLIFHTTLNRIMLSNVTLEKETAEPNYPFVANHTDIFRHTVLITRCLAYRCQMINCWENQTLKGAEVMHKISMMFEKLMMSKMCTSMAWPLSCCILTDIFISQSAIHFHVKKLLSR